MSPPLAASEMKYEKAEGDRDGLGDTGGRVEHLHVFTGVFTGP